MAGPRSILFGARAGALALAALPVAHAALAWLSRFFAPGEPPEPALTSSVTLVYVFAGALYLVVARHAARVWAISGWLVVGLGLVSRLVCFGATPLLEDDVYRYLWDGAVVAHGTNPYAFAPREGMAEMPQLVEEAGPLHGHINYPELRTIYPPTAQAAFALAYLLRPWSLDAWRLVLLLADAATFLLLVGFLRSMGRPVAWSLLYLANPLLIHETYVTLHVDVCLLPFLVGGLWLVHARRPLPATAAIMLAAGVKLWPLLLLPLIWRPWLRNVRLLAAGLLMAAALGTILGWPVVSAGLSADSGFVAYGQYWEMNDAFFMLVLGAVRGITAPFEWGEGNVQLGARIMVALMVGGVLLWTLRAAWTAGPALCRKALVVVATLFLLSPTQFPWYFIWMVPLLALHPCRPLALLTALLPLYYSRFAFAAFDRVWIFDHVVVWIEYIPVGILLLLAWWTSGER